MNADSTYDCGEIPMMTNNSNPGFFFNLGFTGTEMTDELRAFLRKNTPGGITLFKRNIISPEQLAGLVEGIKETLPDNPPLICVDFEGGRVNRLDDFLPAVPSAGKISLAKDDTLPFHFGYISGRILSLLGMDINFAPVADL